MSAFLEIHEVHDGACVRLQLTGELDLSSTSVLADRLTELRREKRPTRLDLSELEFMDSTGIHLLVNAFNDAREDGWLLAIEPALSSQVARLFKLTNLDRILLPSGTKGD